MSQSTHTCAAIRQIRFVSTLKEQPSIRCVWQGYLQFVAIDQLWETGNRCGTDGHGKLWEQHGFEHGCRWPKLMQSSACLAASRRWQTVLIGPTARGKQDVLFCAESVIAERMLPKSPHQDHSIALHPPLSLLPPDSSPPTPFLPQHTSFRTRISTSERCPVPVCSDSLCA